jgi:hypothetical protein
VADSSPTAEKIQPSAFPGRCATITAPTTMKPVKPNSRARLSWAKLPFATDSGIVTTKLARKIPSISQAIQVSGYARSLASPSHSRVAACALLSERSLRADRPGIVTNRRGGASGPLRQR